MILKQGVLATSVLAAVATAASAADMPAKAPRIAEQRPQVSGYVELYGGWARTKSTREFCGTTCSTDNESANGWVLGGAGRVTYWWAPNYSVQLDAQGEGTSYKFTNGSSFQRASMHSYLIGGHANWRDPQRGLIGVFGGAGDATNWFFSSSVRHGLIGGEGQVYWGPVTFYGQAGYASTLGDVSSAFVESIQAWFVRGTARIYVNPNFRLEGTVLYADGDYAFGPGNPGDLNFETWLWRAKAEYKFAASPFSMFVTYEGSQTKGDALFPGINFDATQTAKLTDHRVMGGIRLYINENTLQWNDRNGTTLDIIAPFSVPSFIFGRGGFG